MKPQRCTLFSRTRSTAVGALVFALALVGCGGGNANPDAAPHDANFTVCAGYDAGPYASGAMMVSASGAYTVTLVSVEAATNPPVTTLAVGLNTFTVTVRDAGGGAPAGLAMTSEKPFMPKHNHGASTFPAVADQGDGTFVVSAINFFMPGYWELTLNLLPPGVGDGGAPADKVVLPLCVPS
jgi:hypothetical protein